MQLARTHYPPVLMGLAHGVSDCAAGYLIGTLSGGPSILGTGALLLLYNVLAFGGQLPAGILLDRIGNPRNAAALALALTAIALLIQPLGELPAVTLAGLGSALFHVAGGSIAYSSSPDRASGPGIFAAPGVTGLALGGWMAWQSQIAASPWLIALLGIGAFLALRLPKTGVQAPLQASVQGPAIDRHDLWMILLLMAIGMRSAVWNLWTLAHEGDYTLIIATALAAMTGKLGGGFLADRIGWMRYTLGALIVATPLLSLGEGRPWLFLPGIALLQSATPAALAMMRRFMPDMPATSAGMGLGLAIALGGMPFMLGFAPEAWFFWAGPPLAALGFALVMHKRARTRASKIGG